MKFLCFPNLFFLATCLLFFLSCQQNEGDSKGSSPIFNPENSDPKAIEIADEVINSMGGEKNWDNTRHISWIFFDSRRHFWDKHSGDVRIESLKDDMIILMNINSLQGKVYKDGSEMTHADSVTKYLEQGKNYWINDSYWLVMPFKLKDPGVTLKYKGEVSVGGKETDIIQLTFEDVGSTPENRYLVFVDKDTKLVTQWSFFRTADQEDPNFTMTWEDYKKYDNILLSGKRGNASLSSISVYQSLPKEVYQSFNAVSL